MPAYNLKEKGRKAIARVYLAVEYLHNKTVEECVAVFLHFAYLKAKRIILMIRPKESPPSQENETAFEPET